MKKFLIPTFAAIVFGLTLALSLVGSRNPHGEINLKCETCHTADSWTKMKADGGFDHDDTGFPLIGAHEQTACVSCHTDLKFFETKDQCADCHSDIHRGKLGTQCQGCHSAESWENRHDLFQQHAALGFPLTGVHATADCNSCHQNELRDDFVGTPVECAGCHDDDFRATSNPNHVLAAFSNDCESCHSLAANTWQNARYDHPPEFRLEGGHSNLECQNCHSQQFAGTVNECFACHESDFQAAPDPDHDAANFDHDCTGCHNVTAWTPATFDHNLTEFPLTNGHAGIQCIDCHSAGYSETSTQCFSCHDEEFATAGNPDHTANNFDHDCTSCHSTAAWEPSTFDHATTAFALTGAHVSVDCASCHTDGYSSIPTDCNSCHSGDFTAVSDPNHVTNGFDRDCLQCHTTTAWSPVVFDHSRTGFVLTGGHAGLECASCHAGGYASTSPDCYSCHATEFAGVADPNHVTNNFPQLCAQCHTTESWSPAEPRGFDHAATGFLLTGAHAGVACLDCHSGGFTNTSPQCYSCHAPEFATAEDPNHQQNNFDHDCSTCHSTSAWTPATFDHNQTDFPLTGAHAGQACLSCHASGYTNTATDCFSCHSGDFASASEPNHSLNNFDHNCVSCHTTASWSPSTFDHNATQFSLTGAHVALDCISCHATGYVSTPNDCFACHQTDFNLVLEPNHALQNFSHDCTQCHSTTAWLPASFDHNATDFPLTGAHASLQCLSCHAEGYVGLESTCLSCHQHLYDSEDNPQHALAGFSTECQTCHTTQTWDPSNWQHSLTGYSLTGAHVSADCAGCHATAYAGTSDACFSCHQSDFASASDPDHTANNFDQNCQSCHNTTAWSPSTFDHNSTGFALTAGHAGLACISCHASGYTNTSSDCYSCHAGDFTAAADPNHVSANFDHNCLSCHTTTAWEPAFFDHAGTAFPLTGAHTALQCISCHASGYVNTSPECYSCHQGDFAGATDPNHVTNNFDHNCATCHTTTAWEPASFDHSNTAFPLTGAHTALQCISCHASGYVNTSPECYSCHQGDFAGATDPNHVTNNFDHNCVTCHTTTAWEPASFDHSNTAFPLTGAHTGLQCISCHASGYVNTSSECYSCHQGDFTGATDPNHVANNFEHNCATCHSTTAWSPSTFNHSTTAFPLTGAHTTLQCIACHSQGYVNTSSACYDCHTGDFTSVTDPNHVQNAFSHVCTECHTTTAWTPATFDHGTTAFPLTGAHTLLQCIACHSGGYVNTPMECYSCHQTAYDGTTNPDHAAAQFPTECQNCHSTTAWTPANWNHDTQYFPIYSGTHREKWDQCTDCHVNTSNYSVFECILCHEHNKTSTDNDHQEVNNYQYNSNACLSCHPNGRS